VQLIQVYLRRIFAFAEIHVQIKQDIASFIVFRLGLRVAIVKGVFVVAIDNIYTYKLMEK
jgi:hypothetical protein